jgi:hypothetical protein
MQYPKCPTCGSEDADCRTKGGNAAAVWHAARVVEQPVDKPAGVGTVFADDLVAGLTAVLPMTADWRDGLPMLASVAFQADGDELTLVATDRYTLGTYRLTWDGGHADAIVEAPKDLLAFAKKAKGGTIELRFGKDEVTAASHTSTATFKLYDGTFVNWRNLLPERDPNDEVFGVNAQFIAKFAKAGDKHTPMRVALRSRTKPLAVEIGEHFRGLIMPVKLPDEPKETVTLPPKEEPKPVEPEEMRQHTWRGVEFELPASLYGKALGDALDEQRAEIDAKLGPEEEHEDEAPEPEPVPEPVPMPRPEGKCSVCKGFGVVRKRGANAGHWYKTQAGADEATAKGNSTLCPACQGAMVAA